MKAEIKYTVNIIESERGWGSKVEEVLEFDTQGQADECIVEYNKNNNEVEVPSVYWRAERGEDKIIPQANYMKKGFIEAQENMMKEVLELDKEDKSTWTNRELNIWMLGQHQGMLNGFSSEDIEGYKQFIKNIEKVVKNFKNFKK